MRSLLLALLFFQVCAFAQADKYAPLPGKIVAAKTVYLKNESGEVKLGDAFYREIVGWKRWKVVTVPQDADLILILTNRSYPTGGVISIGSLSASGNTINGVSATVPITASEGWTLHVIDLSAKAEIWTVRAKMGAKLWRTWNALAKDLVADIRKRMDQPGNK